MDNYLDDNFDDELPTMPTSQPQLMRSNATNTLRPEVYNVEHDATMRQQERVRQQQERMRREDEMVSRDSDVLGEVLNRMPNNPNNQRSYLESERESNPEFNELMSSSLRTGLAEGSLDRELPNLTIRRNNIDGGKRKRRNKKTKNKKQKSRTRKSRRRRHKSRRN